MMPQNKVKPKHPTAVTIKENVSILTIRSDCNHNSHGFLARIFSILDKYGMVVDLISTSETNISIAFDDNNSAEQLERSVQEIKKIATVLNI